MSNSKQYQVTLNGLTDLIMHNDNLSFSEKVGLWQKDPANKAQSVAGDDRTPPWRWIGYLCHDGNNVGIPADNLMTMIREGGARVPTGKRQETFKKISQSGIMVDEMQWDLIINGSTISMGPIKDLLTVNDFQEHEDAAVSLGFELFVKRAKIGQSKHIRVRPRFRNWSAVGTVTVLDEEMSGIKKPVLQEILDQAGSLCGLCDWRPSSPRSSGTFGKFIAEVK